MPRENSMVDGADDDYDEGEYNGVINDVDFNESDDDYLIDQEDY